VDTHVTVKQITFDSANTYAVAGTKSVTLESDTAAMNAQINVIQGSHQFQAVVNLGSSADIFTAPGTMLSFNNALNLHGETVTKTGDGTLEINNRVAAAGGSIDCQAGTCSGSGTVGGDLNNSGGTVSPGNSPGMLEVEGDFTQEAEGSLLMEIAGLDSGSQYDVLQVEGLAALSGTLQVALLDAFEPSAGNRFEIFEFGDVVGDFDSVVLPALPGGLQWDDSALLASGILSMVPEPGSVLLMLTALAGLYACGARSTVSASPLHHLT